MFSIKNKIIVVTGGNGLLGREMVSIFRKNGAVAKEVDIFFENKV